MSKYLVVCGEYYPGIVDDDSPELAAERYLTARGIDPRDEIGNIIRVQEISNNWTKVRVVSSIISFEKTD